MELGLAGHSGCDVVLMKKDNKFIVNKSTMDKKYINRLKTQCDKQIEASRKENCGFKIPKVLDTRETEITFSFDMEYVKSVNYIDFFEQYGLSEISDFVDNIIAYVKNEIDNSNIIEVDRDVFLKKWADVKKKMDESGWMWPNILGHVDYEFSKLPKFMKLPIGPCHGDLTFSNILFQGDKNQFIIDFLDSFIETPLMDIVKLRQDTKYGWSKLMTSQHFDENHLIIVSEFIDKKIENAFKDYSWYKEYYKAFQLMNFLRIAQYTKDVKVYNYLIDTLNTIIEER